MSQNTEEILKQVQSKEKIADILDKRVIFNTAEYLIMWDDGITTWEPINNLTYAMPLVHHYEDKHKLKYIAGCYENGDSGDEIDAFKRDELNQTQYRIKWKQQDRYIITEPSWVPEGEVKQHNPEILVDYLLTKIKFKNTKG